MAVCCEGWSMVFGVKYQCVPIAFAHAIASVFDEPKSPCVPEYTAIAVGPSRAIRSVRRAATSSIAVALGTSTKAPPATRFFVLRTRAGSVCCASSSRPFTHRDPCDTTWSRSPRTAVTRPSSTSTSMPQTAWQKRQNDLCVAIIDAPPRILRRRHGPQQLFGHLEGHAGREVHERGADAGRL